MKDGVSQKIYGNMIYSVYSLKMVFLFLKNTIYLSVKKAKMIFSIKNTLKDDICGITEKDDIHPRKYCISSDKKINDDEKVCFCKKVPVILCTFVESFIGVFINCFPIQKSGNLIYRIEICFLL